jgi:hypothetical protein
MWRPCPGQWWYLQVPPSQVHEECQCFLGKDSAGKYWLGEDDMEAQPPYCLIAAEIVIATGAQYCGNEWSYEPEYNRHNRRFYESRRPHQEHGPINTLRIDLTRGGHRDASVPNCYENFGGKQTDGP